MPYLDASNFTYFKKERVVSATGDISVSELTVTVNMFGSEFNRFHDREDDLCSISQNTTESFLHGKYMADLVEETIVYWEMTGNIAPQNRIPTTSISVFDDAHAFIRNALIREKREEKAKAINYNLQTGRIRRWY